MWWLQIQDAEAKIYFKGELYLQGAASIDQTNEGIYYNYILYNTLFLVHLIGTDQLQGLVDMLACTSCGQQKLQCIKAADIHGVSGGAMKYIILYKNCDNNFP